MTKGTIIQKVHEKSTGYLFPIKADTTSNILNKSNKDNIACLIMHITEQE